MENNQNLGAENEIYNKWMAAAAVLDKFAAKTASNCFRKLKYFIGSKINTSCGNDESLSSYDVKIYDAYMRIIRSYEEVASIYLDADSPISSPGIKAIWDGIYAILMSRLLVNGEKENFVNPVEAEKKEIVSRSILAASAQMDVSIARILWNSQPEWAARLKRQLVFDMTFENFNQAIENICESIRKECAEEFYQVYTLRVKSAVSNLNDLSLRHDVSYYNELLKEEQDILKQIVVVQVMALEKAVSEGLAEEDEAKTLEDALNILRETYQKESSEIAQIDRLFSESAARNRKNLGQAVMEIEDFADFAASFEEIVPFKNNLPAIFERTKQNFADKYSVFKNLANEYISKRVKEYLSKTTMRTIYNSKKDVSQTIHMVLEASRCFGNILNYYEDNKEYLLNLEESDIIKGVAETILIKVESLDEAIVEFEKDADIIIAGLSINTAAPEEGGESLPAAFEEHLTRKLIELRKGEKKGPQIIKGIVDNGLNNGICTEYWDKVLKSHNKKKDEIEKKILLFKRDSFFFEISTFEEIMHYSVSRLREASDSRILEFVSEIDSQFKKISDVLTRYGIEKIAPGPHDFFNPKENEVLMVEENPNYKKGEIIKTMNSGYRQNDVVIVRANVIAAR